jgi:putative transposase
MQAMRGIKFRLYPDDEQQAKIRLCCDASRFVWNKVLEHCKACYESGYAMPKMLAEQSLLVSLKKAEPWLREAESTSLQQSLRNVFKAYERAFNHYRHEQMISKPRKSGKCHNRYGFPRYKTAKKHEQSYRIQNSPNRGYVRVVDKHHVKIPKLGIVACRGLREFSGRILAATVRICADGRFECSFCVECENFRDMDTPRHDVIGADVGIKALVTTSNGRVFANPKAMSKYERKLRRARRHLSRKQRGSRNYEKQRLRVARLHKKIANIRKDAIHKATSTIVGDSQVVVVEDLHVNDMTSNHRLTKAIGDAGFMGLLHELEYKCDWYGRAFLRVSRWFPSSKTCCVCGYVNEDLTLSMREWTCPVCHTRLERDLNAACNLELEGRRRLGLTVGAGSPELTPVE